MSTKINNNLPNIRRLRQNLPLPQTLLELMTTGRWKHPGDHILYAKIPFIHEPLEFLQTKEKMIDESGPLMGPDKIEQREFSEYRGSQTPSRNLPWIDVEKTLMLICNKCLGDDVGIALDYRTGLSSPRVVGTDWHSATYLIFREISPSIEAFVDLLDL